MTLIKKFKTRSLALRGKEVNDRIILAFDLPEIGGKATGAKEYSTTPISCIESFKEIVSQNHHLYEILPPEYAVKPYFDLEIEREGMDKTEMVELLNVFIAFLIREIVIVFNIDLEYADFFIADCCRTDKLSYHLIIQNKIYFKNVLEHKTFILYLIYRLKNPEGIEKERLNRLLWTFVNKRGKEEQRYIFDKAPYSSYQCFRFVNQSKMGKDYILKNITRDLYADHEGHIRLIYGTGERKALNVDTFNIEIEKKINRHRPKTDTAFFKIDDSVDFEGEGLCIMTDKKMNYEKVRLLPEYLQYIYLIPNDAQSFDFYRNMAFAVRGAGGTVEDFKLWAAIYMKGEDAEIIDITFKNDSLIRGFNDLRTENCAGIPFLRKYARLAHPAFFDTTDLYVNRYFDNNLQGFRVVKETSLFVSQENTPFEHDILSAEKVLILMAHMGRGKTQSIKRLIEERKYKRILFLSPRIAFAKFIAGEFGVKCYTDMDLTADRLVISMESLWKLKYKDAFDLIVMDESEANLSIFSSRTMNKRQREVYSVLTEFIKNAQKVIFASAFTTNKTLNFVRSLGEPVCCIMNMTDPPRRNAIEVQGMTYADQLVKEVENKKIYACWSSIKQMRDFDTLLKKHNPDVYNNQLNYNGKTNDAVFDTLLDVGETWGKASLVQATPCITVGTSYSGDTFDEVWVKTHPTCNAIDTMQQTMRVRYVKNNKMFFAYPRKKVLDCNKEKTNIQFSILKEYDAFTAEKTNMVRTLCMNWFKRANDYDNKDIMDVVDTMFNEYEETPAPLRDIIMFNLFETAVSQKYYKDVFKRFLKLMNYKVTWLNCDEVKEIKRDKDGDAKYDDVEDIDDLTAEEYAGKIKRKRATAEEKVLLDKYFFNKRIGDTDIEIKRRLYQYWTDPFKKHIINNMFYEAGADVDDEIKKMAHKATIYGVEQIEVHPAKLSVIKELNRRLGIEHSLLKNELTREKLVENLDYLFENRKELNSIFKIRDKSGGAEKNVKNGLYMLNKIYMRWTEVEFKNDIEAKGERSMFETYSPLKKIPAEDIKKLLFKEQQHTPKYTIDEPEPEQKMYIPENIVLPSCLKELENSRIKHIKPEKQREEEKAHKKYWQENVRKLFNYEKEAKECVKKQQLLITDWNVL